MDGSFAISSDIAFTPTVKAIQSRKGSRRAYQNQEENGGWETEITDDLAAFISEQISIFFATANAAGQPYIQHRGGPPGFIRILDRKRLAFADFSGNRQYISLGNLQDNPKAYIFLIDYVHRRRVKIWGEAKVIEDDPELLRQLMPDGYKARPEQVIVFTVGAWSANCPQHIPQRFDAPDVAKVLAAREARIAELEAEVAALKGETTARPPATA
ncbi:pyridoxamine 5'-phosphate oxidase family protein [Bradyrhizobium sp. U87765 SZCCT0131]|uniref:pyridoxamine 5'-phosphate oxidase family protein n=1 Tax=unclassified Bradyrhizobium TaxID=2631580 RepID=UPI001BAC2EE3|nr:MULTISPECIES: pyridoxamine 5'-phosphate oxidase family protein [unclassified Bradyrhizobium]MBR1217599.1 pyridoxamine 5'-phosphate oxidase family protein [Bradyrhizobium sp. U87765 SZCCT0131]MBR1264803.1 pyridoxamine 5'-phosphate oxidase family protein [Bradyrhizobium sp. U87765 SZCCT0134]MBR1304785.1 pyridoxamine 5'-phosphate oxidase family protein [Bradyrhizobium sp. U87765 SZCCT0110]MBR1320572.1 pyridoxamine 5'-phosphate oxidase family protein [Bradyrhizobium sp. U87765 SZCCT0109]MBR1348